MSAHDQKVERRLAEARAGAEPSPGDKARIFARVRSAVGAAPLVAPAPAVRANALGRRLVYGLSAGAVFGLVGLATGFWLGRSTLPARGDVPSSPASIPSSSKPDNAPVAFALPAPKPMDDASPAQPRPVQTAERSTPQRSESRGVTAQSVPPLQKAPARRPFSLADGLELLAQAERALHDDDPALALAVLSDFDRRGPRAMLRQERLTTRVLAACASRDARDAREASEQLQREFPNSIYARRLERSCVDAAPAEPSSNTMPANLSNSGH